MSSLIANIRETKTKGQVNDLRLKGSIPAILYGGKSENKKIYINKKIIIGIINSENFLSNILELEINGKKEKVLPRDITYDPISDEPLHIDFLRIVDGAKIILEIPVKFINSDKSPGLKKGGVLNIVRRKVELRCPTENIPSELIVDLDNTEIGTSIKISSIKLPNNVTPTIQGRDFVVATVASPTVVVEPEKPAEETAAEGDAATSEEGVAATEGAEKTDEKDQKPSDPKKSSDTKKTPEVKKEPTKK
tara:strand:+ start:502 stop:1248 length:747 start_codon:yes stop_codon:yes gene_type:complete